MLALRQSDGQHHDNCRADSNRITKWDIGSERANGR